MLRALIIIILCCSTSLVFSFQSEKDIVRSIDFQLDEFTAAPDIFSSGVFQAYQDKIYYLNRITRDIKVFDIAGGETISTINLKREGPNSVGPEPSYFRVIGEDSILVYSSFNGYKLSLINEKFEVMASYLLKPKDSRGFIFSGAPRAIAKSGDFIFSGFYHYDYDLYGQFSPVIKTSTIEVETSFLSFPKVYGGMQTLNLVPKYKTHLSPTVVSGSDDAIVFSMPLDHSLYVSYDQFRTFRKVQAPSAHLKKILFMNNDFVGMYPGNGRYNEEARRVSILGGRYTDLLFDAESLVYYRVVRLAYSEKIYNEYQSGIRQKLIPEQYSVMVLDSNFEVIGEKEFSADDFQFRASFVTAEGLWVMQKVQDNEDIMRFYLLNINN